MITLEAGDEYIEEGDVLPSSRVLDGSEDAGYMAEYIGYGRIRTIPIKAIYILDWDEAGSEEEDYDWEKALKQGRLEVDIDKLSDEKYNGLIRGNK